ncbi:MAG: hypothetical protein WB761_04215 [Solirubrobacteraceae bacterium]
MARLIASAAQDRRCRADPDWLAVVGGVPSNSFWATDSGKSTGMWLYMIAVVLLIFGIGGSIVSGGIFTIVVLPLGAIVLVSALVVSMWARSTGAGAHGGKSSSEIEPRPLPHTNRPQPGTSGTTSPGELVDARREAQ